jgi:hypothetical protein
MSAPRRSGLGKSAERLLADLVCRDSRSDGKRNHPRDAKDVSLLLSEDLLSRLPDGALAVTAAGQAHAARTALAGNAALDPFIGQHLGLARREIETATGRAEVAVNDCESPLVWLARRKGRDGRALVEPTQLQAGERLRAEFTRAQLTPRVTSNWSAAVTDGRRSFGGGETSFTETVIAARQRLRHALDAVGPEFAGLLLDVCCFLKRLEDVERERGWPARSAKVVLQLALDRLARHYGFRSEISGHARAQIRTWLAPDAAFSVQDDCERSGGG